MPEGGTPACPRAKETAESFGLWVLCWGYGMKDRHTVFLLGESIAGLKKKSGLGFLEKQVFVQLVPLPGKDYVFG